MTRNMINNTAKAPPIAFINIGKAFASGAIPLLASNSASAHRNAVETSEQPRKYAQ